MVNTQVRLGAIDVRLRWNVEVPQEQLQPLVTSLKFLGILMIQSTNFRRKEIRKEKLNRTDWC